MLHLNVRLGRLFGSENLGDCWAAIRVHRGAGRSGASGLCAEHARASGDSAERARASGFSAERARVWGHSAESARAAGHMTERARARRVTCAARRAGGERAHRVTWVHTVAKGRRKCPHLLERRMIARNNSTTILNSEQVQLYGV